MNPMAAILNEMCLLEIGENHTHLMNSLSIYILRFITTDYAVRTIPIGCYIC